MGPPAGIAVLLLLLGAHAASAASITGGPGLMDVLMKRFQTPAGTMSSSSSSSSKKSNVTTVATAAASTGTSATVQQHGEEGYERDAYGHDEYGHLVEKEVCLQETKKRTCAAGTAAVVWTSEFACCQDPEYNTHYDNQNGLRDRFQSSQTAIGSCEWAYAVSPATAVTTNIQRIGLASAVCYFGPESHECGGPLCERLMMSLEGPIYSVANVYSYYGASNTNDAACEAATIPWDNRMAGRQQDIGATIGRFVTKAPQAAPADLEPQPAEHTAGLEYYSDREHPERTVYLGSAYIITGMVTSFAGQRKEKWDEGTFEYTVDYDMRNQVTSGLDSNVPWVRDKTYKFTFLKHASGSY